MVLRRIISTGTSLYFWTYLQADYSTISPVPLRLINGNFDPISGKEMVARFEELVDKADTISFPTIGHYPQTEAPELVLEHFLRFITDEDG